MHIIFLIVRKEFLQLMRSRQLLPFMTIVPLMQIILLSLAANYEIHHTRMAIWDKDKKSESNSLIQSFTGSGFFSVDYLIDNQRAADSILFADKADMILIIPQNFSRDIALHYKPDIQVQINALNNTKAGVINAYSSTIISQWIAEKMGLGISQRVESVVNYWYNPRLNYKTIMVPGILSEIITLIVLLISALNIVREKENGTIEQLNVTPVKKYQFIAGKLLPFWIMAHFIFWIGLLMGTLIFHIPIVGNLLLLEAFLAVYLTVPLGFGLLISTMAQTQQQALFTSFFFLIIFILMCGLFTPLETMPEWAQYLNIINPMKYIVQVTRLIILKGSDIYTILPYIGKMLLYGIIVNSFAVMRYRKSS
jgi:ABC-2 type transport system permease protein